MAALSVVSFLSHLLLFKGNSSCNKTKIAKQKKEGKKNKRAAESLHVDFSNIIYLFLSLAIQD